MKMKRFIVRWMLLSMLFIPLSNLLNAQQLVNPNASQNARALKAFLDDSYKSSIISGQYWEDWCNWVKAQTGQTPAILGLDFMDYTLRRQQEGAKPTDTEKAINWYNNKNGIVTFSWHWDAPMDIYDVNYRQECQGTTGGDARWYKAFYSCATYFDLNAALNNPGGTRYNAILRDIDIVAVQLKRLQDAGVPVLWRPLHESSGGWFWWGSQGAGPCKRLWALMYDRLTNYHKLNNLIWVWNCYGYEHGNPNDWFPGNNMVDIIAYDYPRASSWSEYNSVHAGRNKIFSLAEVSSLPEPNNFSAQPWGYFVTWGDFIQKNNSIDYVKRVYADPKVITLEELPDLKTYLGINKPGNLAYNKMVTVSSTEAGSNNVAGKSVDGRAATRWSSAYSDPQWIQIDLGQSYLVNKVVLSWETAYARGYKIEVSSDATSWSTIYQTTTGDGALDEISGLNASGRYVRVYGTQRATSWGYSIYEMEVYGSKINSAPIADAGSDIIVADDDFSGTQTVVLNGALSKDIDGTIASYQWKLSGIVIANASIANVILPIGIHSIALEVKDDQGAVASDTVIITIKEGSVKPVQVNLALNKSVSVSSTEATYGNLATFAIDGNTTTRWSSLYADPQWIMVDLGATYHVNRVQLTWETAFAKAYKIEISTDGNSWTSLFQTTSGDGEVDNLMNLNGTGRYVRVYGTQRATSWGYSLYEFEVYGDLVNSMILEAENAQLNGVNVSSVVTGFSGSGYVQGFDAVNDNIVFSVQANQAGKYSLQIRYQTPWGVKSNYVYVNDKLIGNIQFPAVSGWGTVDVSDISLNSGSNTIEIRNSWGWFYVDKIQLSQVSSTQNQSSVAAEAIVSGLDYTAFPNPIENQLTVKLSTESSYEVTVNILNLNNNVIKTMVFGVGKNIVLDLANLSSGLYVLQVISNSDMKSTLIQKL